MPSSASSPQASSGLPAAEVMPIPNKTIIDSKSSVYAGVVKDLNDARGRSLPFSVSFYVKIWYVSALLGMCRLVFMSASHPVFLQLI